MTICRIFLSDLRALRGEKVLSEMSEFGILHFKHAKKILPQKNAKDHKETNYRSAFLCVLWRSFAANSSLIAAGRAAL
jgi:hypothetical protein